MTFSGALSAQKVSLHLIYRAVYLWPSIKAKAGKEGPEPSARFSAGP